MDCSEWNYCAEVDCFFVRLFCFQVLILSSCPPKVFTSIPIKGVSARFLTFLTTPVISSFSQCYQWNKNGLVKSHYLGVQGKCRFLSGKVKTMYSQNYCEDLWRIATLETYTLTPNMDNSADFFSVCFWRSRWNVWGYCQKKSTHL